MSITAIVFFGYSLFLFSAGGLCGLLVGLSAAPDPHDEDAIPRGPRLVVDNVPKDAA